MTKQLTFTIKTWTDLLDLWTSNPAFRENYPYLPDLRRYAQKMIRDGFKDDTTPHTNIIYYLKSDGYSPNDSVLIEYLRPYIIKNFVVNGVIRMDLIKNFSANILYNFAVKNKYVIKCINDQVFITLFFGFPNLRNLFLDKLLDISTLDGSPIKCNDKYLKNLYDITGLKCYRPSAYDILREGMHTYSYYNYTNSSYIGLLLKYIEDNNCEWVDRKCHHYNIIKNNISVIKAKGNLSGVHEFVCMTKKGLWDWTFVTNFSDKLVSYSQKHGYDINAQTTNGNKLIHFAASKNVLKGGFIEQLLDNGAKIFDDNGNWVCDKIGQNIYSYSSNKAALYNFLCEYYKDNESMLEKINKFKPTILVTHNKDYTVTLNVKDDYEEIDWSSIPDTSVRQNMQSEYFKLYLKAKDIEV